MKWIFVHLVIFRDLWNTLHQIVRILLIPMLCKQYLRNQYRKGSLQTLNLWLFNPQQTSLIVESSNAASCLLSSPAVPVLREVLLVLEVSDFLLLPLHPSLSDFEHLLPTYTMGKGQEKIEKDRKVSTMDQIIAPYPAGETAAHPESLLMVSAGQL